MKRSIAKAVLFFIYVLLSTQTAMAAPPDPFEDNRHILTVMFKFSPNIKTPAEYKDLRKFMQIIDDETPGLSQQHPPRDVTCGTCHITDKMAAMHSYLTVNEDAPDQSCAVCHTLSKATGTPFYVKPFASLDATSSEKLVKNRLKDAKKLLHYAKHFKDNLAVRAANRGLTLKSASIEIQAEDKKTLNLTKSEPIAYFEPNDVFEVTKKADLLPAYVTTGLIDDLFATLGESDIITATSLKGTAVATVAHAKDLDKQLAKVDDYASIATLLTSTQLDLGYFAPLPVDAIDFFSAELATNLPAAVIKTAKTTTGDSTTGTKVSQTWQILAANNGGTAASISISINTSGTRTNPSTSLQFKSLNKASLSLALEILKNVEAHYPDFKTNSAKFTLGYTANSEVDKNTLTTVFGGTSNVQSKGDLRLTLAHNENAKTGTISSPGLVASGVDALKAAARANPNGIRELTSKISLKTDLKTVSSVSNEIDERALSSVSVSAKQLEVIEGSKDKIELTFLREKASAKPVTVYFDLAGTAIAGKDYVKPKLNATIPANATAVKIEIKTVNDNVEESDKTVVATIAASGAKSYAVSHDSDNAVVKILDDDALKNKKR